MRDAGAGSLHCPDHFTLPAATAFLSYLYTDALDVEAEVQLAMEVLHMATYYGVGRLVSLCEELLAAGLMESDARDPGMCAGGFCCADVDHNCTCCLWRVCTTSERAGCTFHNVVERVALHTYHV